jgi:hypothetical protein
VLRVIGPRAGALLDRRHVTHHLVDMLATASPGGLVAARALNGIAHINSSAWKLMRQIRRYAAEGKFE